MLMPQYHCRRAGEAERERYAARVPRPNLSPMLGELGAE
jgi:hypothetical protein